MKSLLQVITALIIMAHVGLTDMSAQTAPYKFDIGIGLGMSGYIGDANTVNPFKHPGFTADIRGAYIIDTRWQIRAILNTLGLSGSTKDIANVLPPGEQYEFTAQVVDLGVRAEFNFLPYGIGETYKRLKRWTPYLAVGIGFCASVGEGFSAFAPSIPMAFGFRFKANERLNLFAEFSMTKTFTDHLDGNQLADLNHIKTDFYKNTDWYSRIALGVTYEFGKRCETCHYVE